jgi:O-antigen/teichoic acid export membrane protein
VPTFLTQTVGKVAFPALTRERDDPVALRRRFGDVVHLVMVVIVPVTIALLLLAPDALVELFGSEWEQAGDLLRILAIFALGRVAGLMTSVLLNATGRPAQAFAGTTITAAVSLAACVPLVIVADATGVALAFTAGQLAGAAYGIARIAGLVDAAPLRRGIPAVVASALAAAVGAALLVLGTQVAPAALVVFGVAYVAVLLMLDRDVRLRARSALGAAHS